MAEPTYDLFIVHADADRAWVDGYLRHVVGVEPARLITPHAFKLGAAIPAEFDRAVASSRYTVPVLSPAFLADRWAEFGEQLVTFTGVEEGRERMVVVTLHPCQPPPRLRFRVGLDCTDWTQWDEQAAKLRNLLKRHEPRPEVIPCPYPGMSPFLEEDSDRFFGRDREVDELLQRLRLRRFLAVIGPSGSGKSSLVFAGLIPALRRSGLFGAGQWLVRTLRPGAEPLKALADALGGDPADPGRAVSHALTARPDTRHLLLVVDQFEELFTVAHTDVEAFQQALWCLAETPDAYVIVTARADFYSDLMASPLWEKIRTRRVEVVPLDEGGLRQAIVRPAEAIRVSVEVALVERLVADAAGEPGVLPLVQETLVLSWERLKLRFLPLGAYEALTLPRGTSEDSGGERNRLVIAIARHADAALADLTPKQQAIARRIFLRLVQFGEGRPDTPRQQTVDKLRVASDDPDLFEQTKRHLVDKRLLTLSGDELNPHPSVNLAHEALISAWPKLQEWLRERREADQTRAHLEKKADEWVYYGRGDFGLLNRFELAQAKQWLAGPDADLGYTDKLADLIQASLKFEEEIKVRRCWKKFFRWCFVVTAALSVAATAVAVLWLAGVAGSLGELRAANRWEAERLAREANIKFQMIGRAINLSAQDKDLIVPLRQFKNQPGERRHALDQFLAKTAEDYNYRFVFTGSQPLFNLYVFDSEGKLLADTNKYEHSSDWLDKDFHLRDYLAGLNRPKLKHDDVYVSRVYRSVTDRHYKIAVSRRIWDGPECLAVLGVNVTVGWRLVDLDMRDELPGARLVSPMDWSYSERHVPPLQQRAPYVVAMDRTYPDADANFDPVWLSPEQVPQMPFFGQDPDRTEAVDFFHDGAVTNYHRVGKTPLVVVLRHPYPWPFSWVLGFR